MSNFIPVGNRTAFQPVGRCIYCGSTTSLEEEHIVPYSLHGHFVLPEASCRLCARVINEQIETPLLREMLLPIRTALGTRTRKPKDRPRDFGVTLRAADKTERHVRVPVKDANIFAFGLNMPEPGILAGRPANTAVECESVLNLYNPSRTLDAVQPGRSELMQLASFDHAVLLRFLAKVAHGYAVAEYGIDAFDHLLPSCILGVPTKAAYGDLIGGDRKPIESPVDAWYLIEKYTCIVRATQQHYAAVRFKLLAMLPYMPHYVIVAGPLRRPMEAQSSTRASRPSAA